MYSQSVTLQNRETAGRIPELVSLACRFASHISIRNAHAQFNAKSIMGMMSLNLRDGSLTIQADGSDEQAAVEAISAFLKD